MTAPDVNIRPGEVLADKYEVVRVLGRGGMGTVLAARHLRIDEPVAVKILHAEFAHDHETKQRFLREARAALRIKGEHVVRVMDVDVLASGAPYIVMEMLDGCDLRSELKRRGPLPVPEAIDYVLQACEALAEAHVLGIVHRDLKPANLFLARLVHGGTVLKVLDFGISKVAIDEYNVTSTNSMLGTPVYMAPEQMRSFRTADARADIWSLGVVLYQLLTNDLPFRGHSMPEICLAVLQKTPAEVHALRPDVPEGLSAVVAQCLEKDREHRYQRVDQLASALTPYGPADSPSRLQRVTAFLLHAPPADAALATSTASQARRQQGVPGAATRSAGAPFGAAGEPPVPVETAVTASAATVRATTVTAKSLPPRRAFARLQLAAVAAVALGGLGALAWLFGARGPDDQSAVEGVASEGRTSTDRGSATTTAGGEPSPGAAGPNASNDAGEPAPPATATPRTKSSPARSASVTSARPTSTPRPSMNGEADRGPAAGTPQEFGF